MFSLVFLTADLRAEEPEVVQSVDIGRYLGLWYEIARIPNRFQKQCASGTTAEYTLKENGKIEVINRCYRENGSAVEARGIAKIADPESNAKLKVSFVRFLGRNWFWGDYWIIGLDPDYKWAVVGEGSRGYGWILSRTPAINVETRQHIDQILQEQGYDPGDFVDSKSR